MIIQFLKIQKIYLITLKKNFPNIEILNSVYTQNLSDWGVKYSSFGGNIKKAFEEKIEDLTYLDVSDRNVLNLKNFELFKKMKKIKIIDFRGNSIEKFKDMNLFFKFIQNFPKIKNILVDNDLEEILWNLTVENKLQTILPQLKQINNYYIICKKPTFIEIHLFN